MTSRRERWDSAVSNAIVSRDKLAELIGNVNAEISTYNNYLGELKELQEEYQDWYDRLPENLQNSAVGEKLQAITDLDLSELDEVDEFDTSVIDEAEASDLPLGFGRD